MDVNRIIAHTNVHSVTDFGYSRVHAQCLQWWQTWAPLGSASACVTQGKLWYFSKSQFLPLSNGANHASLPVKSGAS